MRPRLVAIWWPPARLPVLVAYRGRIERACECDCGAHAVIGENQTVSHDEVFVVQRPAHAYSLVHGTA